MENRKREVLRMSNRESNQLTRECLQTALIFLMSEMPFEKITITGLVRRSGVSRTAFYRNYSSKEEILNELCTSFLDGLAAAFEAFGSQEDPENWYRSFFSAVRENASLFDLLLQAHMLNSSLFSSYSISGKLAPADAPDAHYEFLAWEGALQSILIHWFQDGMKESVEFMAGLCVRMLKPPRGAA